MLQNDLLAPYLQKKWVDFDQICKDIAFNNHWGRYITDLVDFVFKKLAKLYLCDKTKSLFAFGDDSIFKVTCEFFLKYVLNQWMDFT